MVKKAVDKANRLTADPCVSVADLSKVFQDWLTVGMNKDIFFMLSPPDGKAFTWKTTPNHEWLAKVAPLYNLLIQLVPNTVVTSKKLLMVFKHLLSKGVITNCTKMDDNLFMDWVDQTVRILFAKFREVKRDSMVYDRVKRKCNPDEWSAIHSILTKIVGNDEPPAEDNKGHITLSPPKSWDSWSQALCPTVSSKAQESDTGASSSKDGIGSIHIFRKIMQQGSDPPEPLPPATAIPKATSVLQPPTSKTPEKVTPVKPLHQTWKMTDNTPDMQEEEDGSSTCSFTKEEKALMQQSMNTVTVQPKRKAVKKNPAQATTQGTLKHQTKQTTTQAAGSLTKDADQKTMKHRFTSAAYHKAYKSELASNGGDVDLAKIAGREAYKAAVARFV